MDTYIHCIKALRETIEAMTTLSLQVIGLCREILDDDMMRDEARELMVASYLGVRLQPVTSVLYIHCPQA